MLEQRDAAAAHIEKGFMQAERGELMDCDAAIEDAAEAACRAVLTNVN